MNDNRPVALITGASSGIGAEFARQLAASGFDLILTARRKEPMDQLASKLSVRCEVIPIDLNDPAARSMLAARLSNERRLELLVNNAGFGSKGRFWEASLDSQKSMHQVHVNATVELTHAALKVMVARGRGGVINVASVAAFTRSPAGVSYCSTKAWMLAFSETLEVELLGAKSEVCVQVLCPGFTYSEFHDTLGVSRDAVPKWLWMKAEDVVRESLRGLKQRKAVVIPGWPYRLFVSTFRHLPMWLQRSLQQKSPHTKGRL